MNSQGRSKVIHSRQFVALVRAKLDAAGHTDVAIDRLWINEDTQGYPFLLNVPIGTEMVLPLKPLDDSFSSSVEGLDSHIGHFADALINIQRAENMLIKYGRDVRRAANREVALARSEGLDLLLDGVGFKPTYAYHLTGRSWKEAARHVLATVKIRNTAFHLRPAVTELCVEEPDDVAHELDSLRREQRDRQARLAEMGALGADLEVDAITLDLIAAHDLDAADVLRNVWKRQCVNIPIQHLGRSATLSVICSNGKATASLQLEDAIWNGEYLWFIEDGMATGHERLIGKCLGDRVHHPVFASRPVVQVDPARDGGHRDLIYFDLSDKLLFDADIGAVTRRELLSA